MLAASCSGPVVLSDMQLTASCKASKEVPAPVVEPLVLYGTYGAHLPYLARITGQTHLHITELGVHAYPACVAHQAGPATTGKSAQLRTGSGGTVDRTQVISANCAPVLGVRHGCLGGSYTCTGSKIR